MKSVRLGDLLRASKTTRAGRDSYPLLSMTMHDGLVDQTSRFKKRIASGDVSAYKVVRNGQLVVGFPIDEGVLDFQSIYRAGIVSPAYAVWDLIDENSVDRGYLKRFLRSPRAISYYRSKLRGSTARRRSLPTDIFTALPVPLPPMESQRRVAAILDRAEELRLKRRVSVDRYGILAQSVYIDMFGDPVNARATKTLAELATLRAGRNLVADDPNGEAPFRVLKISAVTSGTFKVSESKPLPENYYPPEEHMVRKGDLLMSRANTAEHVGAVAFVDEIPPNMALPDKIWRFQWIDPDSSPVFYRTLLQLSSIRRRVSSMSSGTSGSMKNIPKSRLEKLELPDIPPRKQQEFAEAISMLPIPDCLLLENLFDSLQHRLFEDCQ